MALSARGPALFLVSIVAFAGSETPAAAPAPAAGTAKVLADFEKEDGMKRWSLEPKSGASRVASDSLQGGFALKVTDGRAKLTLEGTPDVDFSAYDKLGILIYNPSDQPVHYTFSINYGTERPNTGDPVNSRRYSRQYIRLDQLPREKLKNVRSISFEVHAAGGLLFDHISLLKAGEDLPAPAPRAAAPAKVEETKPVTPGAEPAPGEGSAAVPPPPVEPPPPGEKPVETLIPPPPPEGSGNPAESIPALTAPPLQIEEKEAKVFGDFESQAEINLWTGEGAHVEFAVEHATSGKIAGKAAVRPATGFIEFKGLKEKAGNPGEYRSFGMDVYNPNAQEILLRLVFYRELKDGNPIKANTREITVAAGSLERFQVETKTLLDGPGNPADIVALRILLPMAAADPAAEIPFYLDNVRFSK